MSETTKKDDKILAFMALLVEKVMRKWLDTEPEPVEGVPPAAVIAAAEEVAVKNK